MNTSERILGLVQVNESVPTIEDATDSIFWTNWIRKQDLSDDNLKGLKESSKIIDKVLDSAGLGRKEEEELLKKIGLAYDKGLEQFMWKLGLTMNYGRVVKDFVKYP